MSLLFTESMTTEADDILIRFRTTEQTGTLMTTRHGRSTDRFDLVLEGARIRITAVMGGSASEKTVYAGQSLNDDIYHSVVVKRRGTKVVTIVDDDEPVIGESAHDR